MLFVDFLKEIGFDQDEIFEIEHIAISKTAIRNYEKLFIEHKETVPQIIGQENSPTILYVFLHLAWLISESSDEKIDLKNKYRDILIWSRKHQEIYHEVGLMEFDWVYKSLVDELFRLGRLQFEPTLLGREVVFGNQSFDSHQQVLRVHIPEDGPLLPEAVKASFEWAAQQFPDFVIFDCESWLLDPNLQHILAPQSNILNFQNYFHIVAVDYNDSQPIERIFNRWGDTKSSTVLPVTTHLQRAAKAWLEQGNQLGAGYGINSFQNIRSNQA